MTIPENSRAPTTDAYGLSALSKNQGEIKTLHIREAARGRGAGRALLSHIITVAQDRGYGKLWLETGTAPYFAAAGHLYKALGFVDCPPFGDYQAGPDSRFMALDL